MIKKPEPLVLALIFTGILLYAGMGQKVYKDVQTHKRERRIDALCRAFSQPIPSKTTCTIPMWVRALTLGDAQ